MVLYLQVINDLVYKEHISHFVDFDKVGGKDNTGITMVKIFKVICILFCFLFQLFLDGVSFDGVKLLLFSQ